ncbi:ATP-dependent helicase/deoxyribonuclease subunit B [bioreactor metagenome]|uniref:ATP-dependent helicase/deoxyribonuclease subunit B n=1 Tax=bioreactor metagenome TaxID=1076179 RepID=A0A645A0C0_9ZZZZ
MLGTLLHQIIESLIKNYNADYSACPTAELSKFVDEGFSQLYQLYPRQKAAIDLIKQKLLMTITRSLAVLRQLERSQNFKPLAAEQPFQTAVQLKNIRMNLRGVIDRIDTDAEYYRIIDYKSSDHKPSENDFNKGLQLQLLTYLWLMQEQIAKKPYGAYYFSFSDKYTKVTAAKYRRTNHTLEVYDQTDWYETFMKEHQFAGWSFIDTEDKKIFSLEDISARLLALYQQLADRLLAGDINPQPQNEACKYCTYLGICRYYQQDEPAETSENSDEE